MAPFSPPSGPVPYQFLVQSQNVSVSEWFAQLTLCFAPLAGHVLVGIPTLVNRTGRPIPLSRRIPLFNPITIAWRYVMIADRRLRCNGWTPAHMAATNAVFLEGDVGRWTSSEAAMERYLAPSSLIKAPPKSHVDLISVSMLGTLVVVFQGAQALYESVIAAALKSMLIRGPASVFMPIAISSLVRLFAAPWITQDFAFRDWEDWDCVATPDTTSTSSSTADAARLTGREEGVEEGGPVGNNTAQTEADGKEGTQRESPETLELPRAVEDSDNDTPKNPHVLLPGSAAATPDIITTTTPLWIRHRPGWLSITLRVVVLFFFLAMVGVQVSHFFNHHALARSSLSGIALGLLYHVLTALFLALSVVYMLQGKTNDTMIPCVNSTWYLVYTIVWYTWAVVTVVLSALEVRRTSCGIYTVFRASAGLDEELCSYYFAGT
ncbi:hypothetical protein B0T24DRAFT_715921 [Lasiosphaeria ovina]|uniref:Uncharacterized protein n=1 Tax=Lasiosphaeria ovina TaxID=92902 RepID=A0AAE0NME2_9PEZI|nr:hypothetical protein B0T24DRAFT_715921 [Lasiosphaeria ovina]